MILKLVTDWNNQTIASAKKYLSGHFNISADFEPLELLALFMENQDKFMYFDISRERVLASKKKKWTSSLIDDFYKMYVTSNVISNSKNVIKKNGFDPRKPGLDEQYERYSVFQQRLFYIYVFVFKNPYCF